MYADLEKHLATLERRKIIAKRSPQQYYFVHNLLQQACYDLLLLSTKARLHLRIAQWYIRTTHAPTCTQYTHVRTQAQHTTHHTHTHTTHTQTHSSTTVRCRAKHESLESTSGSKTGNLLEPRSDSPRHRRGRTTSSISFNDTPGAVLAYHYTRGVRGVSAEPENVCMALLYLNRVWQACLLKGSRLEADRFESECASLMEGFRGMHPPALLKECEERFELVRKVLHPAPRRPRYRRSAVASDS
jgi:hypothetical protein